MPNVIPKTADKKILKALAIITLVTLTNYWIYRSFQTNPLLGILLFLESLFLYLSLSLKAKTIISLSFIILIFLGIFLVKNYFDKTIFIPTTIESIQKLKNHEYYANELGRIYKNKFGLLYFGELRPFAYRFSHKFFSLLDFRIYFGFDSKQKLYYPMFFFLFFMIGFIYLLQSSKIVPIIYTCLALFFSILISPENDLGPILLFPLLNTCITLGVIQSARLSKTVLK